MHTKRLFSFMIILAFCFTVPGYSDQMMDPLPHKFMIEKIYVHPEQLHITQEGIYFLTGEGNLERTEVLLSDSQGIYVYATVYLCPECGGFFNVNVCKRIQCPNYGKPINVYMK